MSLNSAGIYVITSKSSGRRYIGSASRFSQRWAYHRNRLNKNKHDNPELQNIYNKYGLEGLVFSVVEIIEDKELLIPREQWYLDSWLPEINILKTAGSRLGHKATEDTRAKIVLARTGTKHSDEAKAKMSAALKGNANRRGKLGSRHPTTKGYHYIKDRDIWRVSFVLDGKKVYYGRFKTEEEAAFKAADVKLQLGGFR
jgi:group I intron endonuclease